MVTSLGVITCIEASIFKTPVMSSQLRLRHVKEQMVWQPAVRRAPYWRPAAAMQALESIMDVCMGQRGRHEAAARTWALLDRVDGKRMRACGVLGAPASMRSAVRAAGTRHRRPWAHMLPPV